MEDKNLIQDISQSDLDLISGPLQRAVNELAEYLQKNNNRTLEEEYALVQSRKSGLSKRLRELVIMLVETEIKADDTKDDKNANEAI